MPTMRQVEEGSYGRLSHALSAQQIFIIIDNYHKLLSALSLETITDHTTLV